MNIKFFSRYLLVICCLINLETRSAADNPEANLIPESYIINGNLEAIKKFCNTNYNFDGIYYEYRFSKGCDIPTTTALLTAIRHNQFDIVKFLLDNGADPNLSVNYFIPLKLAINNNANEENIKIIKLLLDHPKINLESPQIFFVACLEERKDIEILLLNKAIDINKTDLKGETALIKMVKKHNVEMVKILLEAGADVNIQDGSGNIALNYTSNQEIIKLLLEFGSVISLENNRGYSFLDSILNSENNAMVYAYRDYIENLNNLPKIIDEGTLKVLPKVLIDVIDKYLINGEYYESLVNEQLSLVNDLMIQKKKDKYKESLNKLTSFLHMHPEFINFRYFGETILCSLITSGRLDIIKELFENPLITRKPNLFKGKPVETARKLGVPDADPAKNVWREIAQYLEIKKAAQEKALSER